MFSQRTGWSLEPNRLSLAIERHRASGRQILDLTASNPTKIGLEYDHRRILPALSNRNALGYRPDPRGLITAREAVCAYYHERGEQITPEQLILTTSTSEGYSFLFRLLCNPDDEVLVLTPSYPLFEFLAQLHDIHLKFCQLFYDDGWHIDLRSLRERIGERTRAILVVYPNNPTGSLVSPDEAAGLIDICARHELALIADEVFLDFSFASSGALPQSFVASQNTLTFTLSGLSKIAGLPQMKFAWIAASGPQPLLADALSRLEIIADTFLSMSAPVQLAAPALFESRYEFQRQIKARIQANLVELDAQRERQSWCSRLELEAGWYAILRVPATASDEDVAIEFLERESVLVHPGHFYDFPSDGHLVVSLIAPEGEFGEGIRRILRSIGSSNSSAEAEG